MAVSAHRIGLVVCLLTALVWPLHGYAQTPTNAALTEWDIFAASGGNGDASQNVAAILMDVSGIAGPAGNVWVTLQNPLPRLGRLDPSASLNNYVEWRPISESEAGGAPLGLALNRSNADIWITVQGDPSFLMKLGGTNTFRRFRSTYPLVPHGIVIASDHAAIAALPVRNVGGIGNAIVKVPRNPGPKSTVTMTLWNVGGEPHHVALDNSGYIWFSERSANRLARLNPADGVVTEWGLPAGTNPAGVRVSGTTVCVVSEGGTGDLTGLEHCLNTSTNQMTQYSRGPGDGFDLPQQNAVNSDTETFVTEQNGSSISFIAFAARATAAVATVTPTTRTVLPKTTTLTVSDFTVTPTTQTIASTQTAMTGLDNGSGYVRFSLPSVPQTFPFPQTGYPQPVSVTPVFNDQGRGTGAVFFGQYFDGPVLGRTPGGRIARFELTAAPVPKSIITNPTTLRFDAIIGQAAPGAQAIAITEANGQPLSWTATKTAPWLTLTPASGAAPSSMSVSVDHALLTAGTYTDTITVDDGVGVDADPRTIALTLNVIAKPTIAVTSNALTFSATAAGSLTPQQTIDITNVGSGTLEWTATADQPWVLFTPSLGTAPSTLRLTVDPGALTTGTYTATVNITAADATNSPLTVAITAVVGAAPTIGLSPASMTFMADLGGPAPAAQTLTVTNTGGGTLVWDGASSGTWLSLSPVSGSLAASASAAVSVTVNPSGLARGTYSGTITVNGLDATNSPQTLAVSLTVRAPVIGLSPTTLSVGAVRTAASPSDQTVTISNTGDATLNYTATVTTGSSWLSVLSGGSGAVAPAGSASLVLAFNTASLPKGVHTGVVQIVDPNADNTPQSVTVTLTITAPTISLTPASLIYTVNQGLNPASQTVTVNNTGDAPLSFTPGVSTSSGGSWLSVSPSGSTTIAAGGSTTLTVSVTSAALAAASYSGTITISDSTATNDPQAVSVSLTVTAVGVLTVSPTSIPVTAVKGGANPANQGVTISNTGSADFTYSASVTGGGTWLSIIGGGSGTLTPSASATLTLAINITGLNKGVHVGTVQVTAPGASNSPQTITVTLTIQAPTISLSPTSLAFTVLRSRNPASQTITLTNTGDATMNFATAASTVTGGSWLAVSPASGTLAPGASTTLTASVTSNALASGSYAGTISITDPNASNSPQTASVSLTVNPAPTISVDASSLTFTASQGGSAPSQSVTVTNTGDGSLTFTPAVTGSWLSVSPSGATTVGPGASVVLTVSVDVSSLTAGPYSGNVQIADANATNSPQNVAVSLTVTAAPVIGLSPATLTFSALRTRNPATQTLTLSNTGDAPLNFTAAASGGSWLAVSPATGTVAAGGSTTLTVTVTSSALASGSYAGTITVSDPAAPNSPQTTAVSLTVNPAPTISLGATSLTFSVTQTLNPADQTVTITNTGDGSLTFTPALTGSWLSVSPSGSTTLAPGGSVTLTVSVASSTLSSGSYSGNIRISDSNATNDPRDIAVGLTVNAAPVISRSPASLTFSVLRGRNPATQTITLTNTGDATMNYTAAASGGAWLAVSPTSGTLAPGGSTTLTVTVTSSALASGSYSGNIAISDPSAPAGNSPQNTSVSLTVSPAPTISLTAGTMTFSGTRWTVCNAVATGTDPGSQTFTVSNTGDADLNFTAAASTSSGGSWLSVSPTSGTVAVAGSSTLTVSVTLNPVEGVLAAGSYSGMITMTDANATNSPQTKAVTLTVGAAAAKLCITPVTSTTSRLDLGAIPRRSTGGSGTVTVANVGDASFTWSSSTTATAGTVNRTPTGSTVAANSSVTVSLTVTTNNATGAKTGTFVVNAGAAGTITTYLSWSVF